MQITVTIPDDFAAQVVARGLTPEGYVERLIAEQAGAASQVVADTSEDTKTKLADLEVFFAEMSAHSHKVPILPDEALTRESFYQDHD
jgi:hypothetical protein